MSETTSNSWRATRIKFAGRVIAGGTPESSNAEYWDGNVPWLTPVDLGNENNDRITKTKRMLTKAGVRAAGLERLPPGSVVISTRAPIGSVGLLSCEAVTNQGCKAIVPDSRKLDSRFAFYFALHASETLQSLGLGTTFLELSTYALKNLPVLLPSHPEQRRIAAYLDEATGKIDRLMGLRRRQRELLREQRAALIQQAVTRGLNPHAPLKDSGLPWLGQIPEHWYCAPIRRFWQVIDCKHVTVPFLDEGYPLASVSEVQSFDLDLSEAKRTSEEFYRLLIEGGRQPRTGDLIYCRNTSVGAAAYVSSDDPIAMGQDVCLIRSSNQNGRYLNYILHSAFMLEQLNTILVGATFKRINVADIKALFVVCPPKNEQDEIVAFIEREAAKLDALHRSYERQLALLAEYRASLIHECVTGQRAIPEN